MTRGRRERRAARSAAGWRDASGLWETPELLDVATAEIARAFLGSADVAAWIEAHGAHADGLEATLERGDGRRITFTYRSLRPA